LPPGIAKLSLPPPGRSTTFTESYLVRYIDTIGMGIGTCFG
jgi:hypothetical protein